MTTRRVCLFPWRRRERVLFVFVSRVLRVGEWMGEMEKATDPAVRSSHFTAQSNVSLYAPAMKMIDNDDSISHKAIGGPAGELLEQNAQALNNISTNLAALQFQDNINLFSQTRDNIITILNDMNDMSDIMKQMPPLPLKINETILNSIFPKTIHQML
uniref:Uncharacterized protein n=1 Tax=Phaseolus vulgaris TaxID=3885 RepID=V7AGE0_PHAVU|nr:hypothetical protein PHAVU_011G052600g [Phaseolus vulgaris]ESW03923.1 hypothetical protein PHAVU_011G052600g [Phaseolus vulgaris]